MADNEKQDIPPKETTEEQVVTPWTVKAAEGSDTIDYDKLISEGLSTDSLYLFRAENLSLKRIPFMLLPLRLFCHSML